MSVILFEEKQRFNAWWLVLILLIPFGIMLYIASRSLLFNETVGTTFINNTALLIFMGFYLIFLFYFFNIHLVTQIKTNGIQFVFRPFSDPHFYRWEEIKSISMVQYAPLKDYMGWGIRSGKNGEAFTVKGNKAIKIVLTNNRSLLIGTQLPHEIEVILNAKGKNIH